MMSDLSFVVVVPLTGPVTPVVVFPVVPIGPLVPEVSAPCAIVSENREVSATKITAVRSRVCDKSALDFISNSSLLGINSEG